jgi:ketosteroid isomerase-like protein
MSRDNVEAVRRLVDGVNADAIPRDLLAADFELSNATTAVTDAHYTGYEGGLEWRRELFDVVDGARLELDEVLAAGDDYVVATTRLVGRGAVSGAPVDMRWASVFRFRDGKIARIAGYSRRRDALEAVGISTRAE